MKDSTTEDAGGLAGAREIQLAHGTGGKLARDLIEQVVRPEFTNAFLEALHDGAVVPIGGERLAFTTDAHVVSPLFFPGGDIGRLAINGTVNDLAMCGATPHHLSAAFILEEGLPMADFRRVLRSMREAADAAGVLLVTGDTKVVERGKADRMFITTTGIGVVPAGIEINPRRARPGDCILLSGPIAEHGMAILCAREALAFESDLASDTAPLAGVVGSLLAVCPDVHVLRDPTRGGLSAALVEIAQSAGVGMRVDEAAIPLREDVRAACELLGLDPLHVANEGRFVAWLPEHAAPAAIAATRGHQCGRGAAIIGHVTADHPGRVVLRTRVGGARLVETPVGEQLPRIC